MRNMKKRMLSSILVTALVCVLAVPAGAYDMGKVGESNIISAGGNYTAAIDENSSLWSWGLNMFGQLGNGGIGNARDDSIGDVIQTVPAKVLDDVSVVSCGGSHTAAIDENGSLWMWGWNKGGQLGNDGTTNSNIPVKVMDNVTAVSCGEKHTAAIDKNSSLWMWGDNDNGQLGNGGTGNAKGDWEQLYQTVPAKVMDDVAAVSCGGDYTAALKTDGSLWMWGSNFSGQLGNDSTADSNVPVKVMDDVATVSCGSYHTAAVKNDGSLWMWGGQ